MNEGFVLIDERAAVYFGMFLVIIGGGFVGYWISEFVNEILIRMGYRARRVIYVRLSDVIDGRERSSETEAAQ